MKTEFKDFPICVNCKYFMKGPCGLTMIDPVTGELQPRRHRQAAAYRKESNPCGPSGLFFKPKAGENKVEPEEKPVVVEPAKESTAKVMKVEVPEMVVPKNVRDDVAKAAKEDTKAAQADYGQDSHNLLKQEELYAEAEKPKKRRSRSKSCL
jgi:hypothetical protein